MARIRISLANKCQLLFGAAVLLIVAAALAVPWIRLSSLVADAQREIGRELSEAFLSDQIQFGELRTSPDPLIGTEEQSPRSIRLIMEDQFFDMATRDTFIATAIERFNEPNGPSEILAEQRQPNGRVIYRYVRAVREGELDRLGQSLAPTVGPAKPAYRLKGVVLVQMRAQWADRMLLLNRIYTIIAGMLAVLLAIAVFWFITTRLILSPVRLLRQTTEKVAEGDLSIRSDINTGDEFEQFSRAFNAMLSNLRTSQERLRDLNRQLDMKLGELSASNDSLYQANRVKDEFLANVSHELRTPLNSIIGFAELMGESLRDGTQPLSDKQQRYIGNILNSGRSLLQLVTDLLDLARIEAGRAQLHIEKVAVSDVCELLANMMRPQADQKDVEIRLALARRMPVVETDAGKFQQILFNFLSNAVKFSPRGGRVEIGSDLIAATGSAEIDRVRVWVGDTGPGIPVEQQQRIFEKFHQLDPAHTKEQGGTGLGLAISRELARLLQGQIEVESVEGRGAVFSLTIPLVLRPEPTGPIISELSRTLE